MIDIETGDRGYVITGEESYLEPYTVGKASVSKQLQDIRKLTSDNPASNRDSTPSSR